MDDRERAWDDILTALPDGWRVTLPSYDPARRLVEVVARSRTRGGRRSPPPEYVIGLGADELAALHDLAERLTRRDPARKP